MQQQLKVAFFGVKPWEKGIIEREIMDLPTFGVGIFSSLLSESILKAEQYQIISVGEEEALEEKLLQQLPQLQLIVVRGCELKPEVKVGKVKIILVEDLTSRAVAEYTMALVMAVAKKIIVAKEVAEEGDMLLQAATGIQLYKKKLGVIGVGKVGQKVVGIAKGLGMHVMGVKKKIDQEAAKKGGYKAVDLETCLKDADIVTIQVPSTPETYHLINKKMIGLMKKGSILVSTSRGPVVDTKAVLWGLNQGILRGAGFDAVEEEVPRERVGVENQALFCHLVDRDDVVFTPHNAINVEEVWEAIIKETVAKMSEYMRQ